MTRSSGSGLSAGVDIGNFRGAYDSNTTRIYTLPSSGWVMGSLVINLSGRGTDAAVYLNTMRLSSIVYINHESVYNFAISLK